MNPTLPITVIRGGIAGLVSAIALHRSGFSVKVFEPNPKPHELGAGITLWSNAVAILDQWGLGNVCYRGIAPYAGIADPT